MSNSEIDPALDPALDQVTRRTLLGRAGATVASSVIAGSGAAAQETKAGALQDSDLQREDARFESGGKQIAAFLCRPKSAGKRGSVIVIHEIFGLTDHIRDIACRFARAGYNGLAVDFFSREGAPPSAASGFQGLMEFVSRVPDAQIMGDIRAASDYLRHRRDSNGRAGTVGFCWGGRISMLASANVPHLDAAVAYYGRIRLAEKNDRQTDGPLDVADRMRAPLLGHFGAEDRGIPVADVDALRTELRKRGKTAELFVYEGAGHAFNNDTRESYHAASAKLAWARTLDWFAKYLESH